MVRCGYEKSRDRLLSQKDLLRQHPSHRYYSAAVRLNQMLSGDSTDIFSVDVFSHKSCHIKFAINAKPTLEEEKNDEMARLYEDVLSNFYLKVRLKILSQKQAFLLHQLLSDFTQMCKDYCVPDTYFFTSTKSLKRYLSKKIEDELSFFPSGKFVIVHSSSVNPCEYSIATLQGDGLRDEDFVKSFASYVKRKISERTSLRVY